MRERESEREREIEREREGETAGERERESVRVCVCLRSNCRHAKYRSQLVATPLNAGNPRSPNTGVLRGLERAK